MPDTMKLANEMLAALKTKVSGGYELKHGAYQRFLTLCELADALNEEFGVDEIQIDMMPGASCGSVVIETDEFIFEHGRTHPFFEYIKAADSMSFSKSNTGSLRLRLVVKDLWVEK